MAFDTLARDLRYTIRALRRDAAFTTFAILIVGLGIGASSTVFSVVNALVLRPLPFTEPGRLVWIANRESSGLSGQTTQVNHLIDLRARAQSLASVAGYFAFYGVGDNVLTGKGEPERLSGVPVTVNFFEVLGVRPLHGRTFTEEEGKYRGPRVVLLGHGLWQRRFASDPAIVGTTLTLNDQAFEVVGVLPASFDFASFFAPGSRFDLYFPFALSPETNRWGNTMAMIGRLAPGATVDQARAEVRTLAAQFTRENQDRNSFEGHVKPLAEQVSGRMRLALWVLAGAVGVVMLIVCANLSNLLLARTASRHREIAIRVAMGAGRRRLAAQMLTEGLVLSGIGSVVGLVLAITGTRALAGLDAIGIPLLRTVHTDMTVLGFTVAVAITTGIVFGLAPALHTPATALHDALKDATRGSTEGRRRRWVRNALVVSEIAFACVLLVGAGLLIRSFIQVLDVDLGFDASRVSTIRVDPDRSYATPEQRDLYFDDLLTRVRAMPGVEGAGITDALPLGRNRTWGARAKGQTYERGRAPTAFIRVVSDGYVSAMGIPLRAGRDFSMQDRSTTEPVVMINETMARRLWPGEDPIGKVVLNACAPERTVVGVVGDVRHLALEQESGNEMYLPMRQCRDLSSADLVLQSTIPPATLAGSVRATLKPLAPNLAGNDFRGLQQLVDKSVSPRRFLVLLIGAFAAFALMLASIGIFALISYSVSQRTQEIGIRMALGASARDVQAGIMKQTLWLAAIGMVIGGAASWALAQSIQGLLFGVTAADPLTFLGVLVLFAVVAAVAGYLPARRASRIDPLVALRAG